MFKLKRLLAIPLVLQAQFLIASDWRLLSMGGSGDDMVYTFGDMQGIVYKDNTAQIWIKNVPYMNITIILQKYITKLSPECDKLYDSGYIPEGISSFNMKMDDNSRRAIIELLIYSELVLKTNEVVPKQTALYEFNIPKKQFRILTSFEPGKLPDVYPESVKPPWYFIAPDTLVENLFKAIIKNKPKKQ